MRTVVRKEEDDDALAATLDGEHRDRQHGGWNRSMAMVTIFLHPKGNNITSPRANRTHY